MWIFKSPEGPSFKFQVNSITTLDEPKMIGNCLKYSRPILSFDKSFDDEKTPHLGLMKEVLTSVFNTPKLHPKSKPFHDHIETFNNINDTIYFRNSFKKICIFLIKQGNLYGIRNAFHHN